MVVFDLRSRIYDWRSAVSNAIDSHDQNATILNQLGLNHVNLTFLHEGRSERPTVVYGHVAAPTVEWLNNTICLDSGCCYGGRLTALRWPEREIASVPAARIYYEAKRPLAVRKR